MADRDVAAAGLAVVDRRLVLQTVALYLQAVRARGVLATLTANRDGLTTLVDAMRRRVEAGTAAESDLLRFEAEAARIDIDIARATLDLERSLGTLTVVVGAPRRIEAAQLSEPEAANINDIAQYSLGPSTSRAILAWAFSATVLPIKTFASPLKM